MGEAQRLVCAMGVANVVVFVLRVEKGPTAHWPSALESEPAARQRMLVSFGLIGFEPLVGEAAPLATTQARLLGANATS